MINVSVNGSGQPIILLHGFCENHHIWDNLAAELALKYLIISIDLPGFGESTHLPKNCTSIDNVADIIAEEITNRNIASPIIVGHSLGGYVCLALAHQYPKICRGLVLVNSTTFGDSVEKKKRRNKVIRFISKHGVEPFVTQFVQDIFYNKEDAEEAFESVTEMGLSCSKETIIRYTVMMRERLDRTFLLQQTILPIMVIAGREDSIVPIGQSHEMINSLPLEQGILLASCGHMAMYEQPEVFLRKLDFFVSDIIAKSN